MKRIEYYRTKIGREPFRDSLVSLETSTRLRILGHIERVAAGAGKNNIKPVGSGVRAYFGQVGSTLILLLIGGEKDSQFRDIRQAKDFWSDYENTMKI